ncbi:MAG TPA: hypothetical protein VEL49_09235 [Ktedonobacteraceae bacterium]|nr:hypothetical protein [Ktedonobacteraceae bacterium]
MLKLLKIGQGQSAVVLTCDRCGKRIDNPNVACYTWREYHRTHIDEDAQLHSLKELVTYPLYVDDGKLFTLHKGTCFTQFQAANGGSEYRWPLVELVYLPGLLINNLGMTFAYAEAQFHLLDTMGV